MSWHFDGHAGTPTAGTPSGILLRLLRRARPAARRAQAESRLGVIAGELRHLNSSTEKDFLAAGKQLHIIVNACKQIADDLAHLAGVFSGDNEARSMAVLHEMQMHFRGVEASIASSGAVFATIRQSGLDTNRALSGLDRILPELRAVGTATKIEAARLGSAGSGFEMVANEVQTLTQRIGADVRAVVEAAAGLNHRIEGSLRTLNEMNGRQGRQLPETLASLVQAVERMQDGEKRALAVTEVMKVQSAGIEESISRLVTEIQFHDITRQQIEHVIEALDLLRGQTGQSEWGDRNDAAAALAVQVSQLEHAATTFGDSTAQIDAELGRIADRVAKMAKTCRAFWGARGDGHDNLFLELERSLSAVLGQYSACAEAESAMREASRDLSRTLHQMRETASGVDSIDAEMQRVALNATIRAAHIGAQGMALGVLADSIHALARCCGQQAGEVVRLLDAMLGASASLVETESAGCGESGAVEAGGSAQVSRTLGGVHAASEAAFARLQRVDALCARLGEDVAQLRGRFEARELFAQTVGSAVLSLHGMLGGLDHAGKSGHALGSRVDTLSGAYTMAKEREIHARVTGLPEMAVPAVATAVGAAPAGESEFGENVELF